MPPKGYSVISVSDEVKAMLDKERDALKTTHRKPSYNEVLYLLLKANEDPEFR